ncbi:MAG TPA: corrinoid protein [Caldilineaceae bacterium]|nr:corrinoid protein [Caldilineaceae bacterium]
MEELVQKLKESVVAGDHQQAAALTGQWLAAGGDPARILNEGLIAGMSEVGELFKCGEYFVPEMLVAARAMKRALAVLRPKLVETGAQPIGTIVLGTVSGDIHDIGKNLAGMVLEGAGLRVVDLGVNVTAGQFVAAVKEHRAELLGLSALLTTTMTYTGEVIRALEAAGLRDQVKVIVGGAPVTEEWSRRIGADAVALDAASGAEQCKALLRR